MNNNNEIIATKDNYTLMKCNYGNYGESDGLYELQQNALIACNIRLNEYNSMEIIEGHKRAKLTENI